MTVKTVGLAQRNYDKEIKNFFNLLRQKIEF